jgi:hypothetical protein
MEEMQQVLLENVVDFFVQAIKMVILVAVAVLEAVAVEHMVLAVAQPLGAQVDLHLMFVIAWELMALQEVVVVR